jgi:hypothetical protein
VSFLEQHTFEHYKDQSIFSSQCVMSVTHPRRGIKFFDFLKGQELHSWFLIWKVRELVRPPGQGSFLTLLSWSSSSIPCWNLTNESTGPCESTEPTVGWKRAPLSAVASHLVFLISVYILYLELNILDACSCLYAHKWFLYRSVCLVF